LEILRLSYRYPELWTVRLTTHCVCPNRQPQFNDCSLAKDLPN